MPTIAAGISNNAAANPQNPEFDCSVSLESVSPSQRDRDDAVFLDLAMYFDGQK
jgi:hypothetical protein